MRLIILSLFAASAAWSQCPSPRSLCVDDFRSGALSQRISTLGTWHSDIQSGSMLGGYRVTSFISLLNPYGLAIEASINPAAGWLAVGNGPHTGSRLDLYYGLVAGPSKEVPFVGRPLNADVSAYDRLRINVGYNDNRLPVLVMLYAGGSQLWGAVDIPPGASAQAVDLPFSSLTYRPTAGPPVPVPPMLLRDMLRDLDHIWLIIQGNPEVQGASDYVVRSLEFATP